MFFLAACGSGSADGEVAFSADAYTGDNQFVQFALEAIEGGDFYEIDGMRDVIQSEDVAPFVATYNSNYPQTIKNEYVNILMDQSGSEVKTVMMDGLKSNSYDVRATSLVSLTGNGDLYSTFYDNEGFVIKDEVDKAVATYLAK